MATTSSVLLSFPPFQFDVASGRVWHGTHQYRLKPQAAAVLLYLVEHSGQTVSKEELFTALWPGVTVSPGVLRTCLWEIRQALRDRQRKPRFIETIPRRGYRFIGAVRRPASEVRRPQSPAPNTQHIAPNFVGRETELRYLHERLEKALSGERQVVFVSGEPGIGKTTLVQAFLSHVATTDGLRVAQGQCLEHFGVGEAYLPILEALGRLCRQSGGKQLRTILRQYAPSWLAHLPALVSRAAFDRLQREVQGVTRARMLREMAEALEVLTSETRLVLVLEDLHWSDPSTLDLVSFLARRHERAHLLVIGAYRPADILGNGHPLRTVIQELSAHGHCAELPVASLSEAAVGGYLTARFASSPTPAEEAQDEPPVPAALHELTRVIHRRTEGNPLFLVNMVDYLLACGAIARIDGRWTFLRAVDGVRQGVPQSIQQMIERQLDRLNPADQRLLEVASVAGVNFSAAVVAAATGSTVEEIEEQCTSLVRRALFLQCIGAEEWPDGLVSARYNFLHALYQQVLYQRISTGRLVRLHRQIGERIEQAHGERARERAAELATHFERGREYRRVVHYLRQAGENAARRTAHTEAINLLSKGIDLLQRLPPTPEGTRQKIRLHLAMGTPLIALKGYAAAEAEHIFTQARELCEQIQDPRLLFHALLGLGAVYHNRAAFHMVLTLAEQLQRLAHTIQEPTYQLWAHVLSGQVLCQTGQFILAQEHFTQGIALYDTPKHNPSASDAVQDPGVHCLSSLAEVLWLCGYPDQALRRCHEALTLTRRLSHPHSRVVALASAALLHTWLGKQVVAQELAEELTALARDQGFPQWLAVGTLRQERALVEQGLTAGVEQIQQGLAAFQATGARLALPGFFCELAWAQGKAGRVEEGLALLAAALVEIESTKERLHEAEVYWLKGQLTLQKSGVRSPKSGVPNTQYPVPSTQAEAEAEVCFLKALKIARRQHAKSLELRAVISLSRLWQRQGKKKQAHQKLAKLYGWFSEGFETADLQEAKALLAELT